eukprot:TRINITY_DN13161_c0_g2_i1.p1 TRINITY_DN13161_c0_g2~~TRINITY_DN13161_c0_g2_i1.p1  ORF type:complete len:455 (-),score=66.11 TRINITY_DN13161_c0_g2_i1:270-1499(-)
MPVEERRFDDLEQVSCIDTAERTGIGCCGCTVVEYTGGSHDEIAAPMPIRGAGVTDFVNEPRGTPKHRGETQHVPAQSEPSWTGPELVECDMPEDPRPEATPKHAPETSPRPAPKAAPSSSARPPLPPPPQAQAAPTVGCCGLCPGVRIEEHEMLKETWWFSYCFCCGAGCMDHCGTVNQQCKCVCLHFACEPTEEAGPEGVCGYVDTCCFCTHFGQWPPRDSTPLCSCFSMIPCGFHHRPQAAAPKVEGPPLPVDAPASFWDFLLFDQILPWYCYCCGCSLHTEFQEICNGYSKCGGCKIEYGIAPPCMVEEDGLELGDEGLCLNVGSCWYLRTQFRVPLSLNNNPICAMCGWRLRKPHGPGKPHPALRMQAEQAAAEKAAAKAAAKAKAKSKAAPSPPTAPKQQEMA